MTINNREKVKCILDGGSQIVAMAEHVALKAGISWDPRIILNMQSANGQVNPSLGLARNVPVTIPGGVTVYLQIYIIRNAAYDVLLGRPFDALLSTRTENLPGEEQVLTICCPNTAVTMTIPTYARGEHPAPSPAQILGFRE